MAGAVAEMLSETEIKQALAEAARSGVRCFFVVGKIRNLRRSKPNQDGVVVTYAELIFDEGDALDVSIEASVAPLGERQCGCFQVVPRMFKGAISGFKVIEATV